MNKNINKEVAYAINPKDKNHTHFIGRYSYQELIEKEGTICQCVIGNTDLLNCNTFVVNAAILKHITATELDEITKSLLNLFPDDKKGLNRLYRLMDITQTWRSDEPISISDYTLMEYNGYIISFHLDLQNGLGMTLSSVYRKEDIQDRFKEDFNYKIKLYGGFLG